MVSWFEIISIYLSPLPCLLSGYWSAGRDPSRRIHLHLETLQDTSDARVLWSLWRLLQPIGIIWRLLIRERSWEAVGQQEKSGISRANRCATILPAYAINPKSPTVDEDALFWWHADVSLVRFQLDFGDFDFLQSRVAQLGRNRQDNDRYGRFALKRNPTDLINFISRVNKFCSFLNITLAVSLTTNWHNKLYFSILGFFVPASWRGRAIWIHTHAQ